jgi:hypothetical protein
VLVAGTTLIASLGGYVLAGRNERRRDRRQSDHDHARVDRERITAAVERGQKFELESLLDLQDAVQVQARMTGRAMHFDHMQARRMKYTQLPPEWSDEMLVATISVNRLSSRILSDELRRRIDTFAGVSASSTLMAVEFEGLTSEDLEQLAFHKLDEFGNEVRQVQEALGAAIRTELSR